MSKLHPLYDLLRADGSIVVNKALIFAIGHAEAIIFSELISRQNYFADRVELIQIENHDGYFFNTVQDLYSGTGYGDRAQRSAIANLQALGLIDVKLKGVPPKRYFMIWDTPGLLTDLLREGREKAKKSIINNNIHRTQDSISTHSKTNNTNLNNSEDQESEIDPELMRDLSILVSAHEQAKPTRKQILQRSHSVKAQSGNGKGVTRQ